MIKKKTEFDPFLDELFVKISLCDMTVREEDVLLIVPVSKCPLQYRCCASYQIDLTLRVMLPF